MADIKKLLLNNMANTASKDQAPYIGLSQEIKGTNNLTDECSKIATKTLLQILNGAEKDTLDGLKTKIERIKQLEAYIKEAKVGPEETTILLNLTSRVKSAITKHLQEKRSLLSKTANLIEKSSVDVGSLLNAMSKNDPLMRMVVAGGGALAKKVKQGVAARRDAKTERNQALFQDANNLATNTLLAEQQAAAQSQKEKIAQEKAEEKAKIKQDTQKQKEEAKRTKEEEKAKLKAEKEMAKAEAKKEKEEEKARLKKEKDEEREQLRAERGGSRRSSAVMQLAPGSSGMANQSVEVAGNSSVEFLEVLVLDISDDIKEIKGSLSSLVELELDRQIAEENKAFDDLELASEAARQQAPVAGAKAETGDTKKGLAEALKSRLASIIGPTGMGILAAAGPIAGIAAGLLLPALDGILGVFKAQDWGVSKVAAFLGGMLGGSFNNKIVNVFANAGKWAVMGATLGAPLFGVGAIAGGLVGALIGGILGLFGGEKIAQFLQSLGDWVTNAFNKVVEWGSSLYEWVSTKISDMWGFLSDAVEPGIEIVKESAAWIGEKISFVFDPIKEAISSILDWFVNIKDGFLAWIDSVTPDWAKGALSKAADIGGKAVDVASDAASAVSGAASSAWEATKSAAGSVAGMFGGGGESAPIQQAPSQPMAPTTGGNAAETRDALMVAMKDAGISSPQAQGNILAQVDSESKFKPRSENMNYKPETLMKVFPKYFKNINDAKAVVAQGPEAIANRVYGGRNGNAANEGFKYRGRGLIQLTGKANYAKFGKMLGIDLVNNPDLANDPKIASQLAIAYFKDREKTGTNLNDANSVSKAVGFADPTGQKKMQRAALSQQYAQQIQSGEIRPTPATTVANKDVISNKAAQAAAPVVNVVHQQNAVSNNVRGGGQSNGGMAQNGTSGRRSTVIAATNK